MSDVDTVLRRVIADLALADVDRVAGNRALATVGDQVIEVRVATRGRMLLWVTETTFATTGPAWSGPGDVEVEVGHTGAIRRTGIRARATTGGAAASRLAAAVAADADLAAAMLPLDATRFTVTTADGHLRTEIVLMGASMTRMRLPPTAQVIGLHDDQRDALLATVDALVTCWSGLDAVAG